jgi:hypothetical protein
LFAGNLAGMLANENGATPEPAEPEPTAQASGHVSPAAAVPAPAPAPAEQTLDLLSVAGLPVLKRIVAPVGGLVAVLAAVLIWRRRRQ